MSVTILEALMNAEINLLEGHPFQKSIGLNQLHNAIQNHGNGLDINVVLNQVKERLPNFVG